VLLPVLILGLAWAAPRGATYAAGLYAAIEWMSVPLGFWLLTREMPLRLGYFLRPAFEFAGAAVILVAVLTGVVREGHFFGLAPSLIAALTLLTAYVFGGVLYACLPMGRLALSQALHSVHAVTRADKTK